MNSAQPAPWLMAIIEPLESVETRRPVRDWLIALGASAVVGGGAVAMLGVRRDAAELPIVFVAGVATAWIIAGVVLFRLALVPARGQVVPRARAAAIMGILAGVTFVAGGLAFAVSAPSSAIAAPGFSSFVARGWPCVLTGLAVSVAPVLVGLWALRGVAPLGGRALGIAIGAAGGALGGLVLHVYCPIANHSHVGLIHGGIPLLAAAAAGALAFVVVDRARS